MRNLSFVRRIAMLEQHWKAQLRRSNSPQISPPTEEELEALAARRDSEGLGRHHGEADEMTDEELVAFLAPALEALRRSRLESSPGVDPEVPGTVPRDAE